MKIILKTLKYLAYSILGLVAFLLLYLLSAVILSRIEVNAKEVSTEEETIWVLSNGAHTDIIMPVKNDLFDWQNIVSQQDTRGKGQSPLKRLQDKEALSCMLRSMRRFPPLI